MEELQVIETTEGRQFKPWASREDVQAIEQAVEQAVQDPASITAITSEIAGGKQAIASAINAKGGSASATESFTELAQDIQDTPTSGVLSGGIVQSEPFSFLDYVCHQGNYPITEIDDNSVTVIDRLNAFRGQTRLLKTKMTALNTISSGNVFENCTALQEIEMPDLVTISGAYVFNNCSALRILTLPSLTTIAGYCLRYADNLVNLTVGTLVNAPNLLWTLKPNLRNVTIGQDTNINVECQSWTATNVIAKGQSAIDELNNNLYNNLLTKLYDHSEDGQTRTLRIGWLANVTAENIAYANAKGWTLTT